MATQKVYVGDVGTVILLDTGVDISTATKAAIKVKLPNGQAVEWVGTVAETTKVSYTIQSNDLSVKGDYKIQAYVEMPGWTGRGETVTLKVYEAFT